MEKRDDLDYVMYFERMIEEQDFLRLQQEIQANSLGRSGVSVNTHSYHSHYYSFGQIE